jgi:putative NADPH-quinone reductase
MASADTATGAAQPARHVLAVYAHPWAHSFTGFILHSAVRGVRAAGLRDVRSQFFYEADDDPESHEEHLRLAYELGKTFLAAERA